MLDEIKFIVSVSGRISVRSDRQQGEAASFLTGLGHPVSGLDHVLAMMSVGLWGAQLGRPAPASGWPGYASCGGRSRERSHVRSASGETWIVSAIAIGCIAFACMFGGVLLGIFLRAALPEHHLSTDSKDVVKLGMGLLATMAALVLSLLIASAKSSYDTQSSELTQMAANVFLLDRVMAHYGPETKEARDLLRRAVARALDGMWPKDGSGPAQWDPTAARGDSLYDKIQALSPRNEAQRSLRAEALRISTDLGRTRWLLFGQGGSSIPVPFLVILIFWVAVIFISFGLFAPPNATAIATLFVCALSVSGAIFLILELDRPFEGFIQMSSAPLRNALAHLGQ